MANPDEGLVEFTSMTEEECRLAREHRDEIEDHGATEVHVHERGGHPNKIEIWAPTQEDAERAADYYTGLYT